MALFLLAFLGGVLTIASPCILPVLPFVFSKANGPFRKSGLPLLAGMALTFAVLAALASVGGGWIVQANQYGRIAAMALLAMFGVSLLWEGLAERLSRPLVQWGGRIAASGSDTSSSLLLGIATGLLWAPCAGPILGLILTGAALGGATSQTALLLLAYAAGAALSLAIALLAGAQLFRTLKKSLSAEVWIRRVLGAGVLAGVAVIAFGLDRGLLTQLSLASTSDLEQSLVDKLQPRKEEPGMMMMSSTAAGKSSGPKTLPELSSARQWINTQPLTPQGLKGQVVLVDFWTYSCINCLRTLPYMRAWADRYKDSGLVVIGVHTPEFPFEKDPANVERAVQELKIGYPVALDNDYGIWKEFGNKYWPSDYLIDANGRVRYHHYGEGKYEDTEKRIQALLKERNGSAAFDGAVQVAGRGAEAPPDSDVQSLETYLGYDRADNFLSPGGLRKDISFNYSVPGHLELNQWAIAGAWTDGPQAATLDSASGRIVYRFHARDVHLVLGSKVPGKTIRFRVKMDGREPRDNHGVDTDAQGNGVINEHRLYQLIRRKGSVEERTFEIEFLDAGVQAFAFTFG